MQRRRFCLFLSTIGLAPALAAADDDYPGRAITLIVPFGPGLSTDAIARYMADEMGKIVGQSIIVENRPGAEGSIGSQLAARAQPNGYTLIFVSNGSHAGNVALFKKLPYDPVKDFTPVGAISAAPWALAVRTDLPAQNLPEFLRYASERPGTVTLAHGSASSRACVALLETKGGIDVNDIPYKSLQPAMIDVEAKRLDACFLPLGVAITAHNSGRLRVLAITAPRRSQLAPDIPAMAEDLPGYELVSWIGIMAPAGTPPGIVDTLHAAMAKVLSQPKTVEKLAVFGHDELSLGPAQFANLVATDIGHWQQLVRDAHIPQQ